MAYLSSADGMLHGRGPTLAFTPPFFRYSVARQLALLGRIPMEGWPPGYSILLALGTALGLRPLAAARVYSVGAGALLGVGAAWILRRHFRLPLVAVAAIGGLVVLAPNHVEIDLLFLDGRLLALSEGIFIPLSVAVLVVGAVAFGRRSWWWVLAACGLVAAATIVRSTGPTLGIGLAAGALVDPSARGWSKRFAGGAAAALAASGVVATGVWGLLNRVVWHASGHSSRQLGWYPDGGIFRMTCRTVSGWFGVSATVPTGVAVGVTLVTFVAPTVAVGVPGVRRWVARERPVERATLAALGVVILASWAALAVTNQTLSRDIAPTPRHLSIVQPFVYLLDGVLLVRLLERLPLPAPFRLQAWQARRSAAAGVLLLGCAALPGWWTVESMRSFRPLVVTAAHNKPKTDFGLVSRKVILASDNPPRVWNSARRPVLLVPPTRYITTHRANPDHQDDQRRIASLAGEGTLLLVSYGTGGLDEAALRTLARHAGVERQAHCADGAELWAVGSTLAASAARRLCEPLPAPG
jgi:hypothetical protein